MSTSVELIVPIELANKELAAALNIPEEKKRQRDLQYITAVLVSSGENLNHAYFLPSELIRAHPTILSKAMDIEHDEQKVIGHIYESAFMWKDRTVFDPKTVSKREDVDDLEMDIAIAGVVYRDRFPEVSNELEEGNKWKVSMECYYEDYDLKVGGFRIPSTEAEALGYNNMIGKFVLVKEHGDVVAKDKVARVLRNILFSGCGLVEKPANPDSVVMEVASLEERIAMAEKDNLIINLDNVESWAKAKQEREAISLNTDTSTKEKAINDETISPIPDTGPNPMVICASFKHRIFDDEHTSDKEGEDRTILHENWCTLYEKGCLVNGDALNDDCYRWGDVVHYITESEVIKKIASCDSCDTNKEKLYEAYGKLLESMKEAQSYLEESETWTTKYVNDLPNSSFILVEKGYKQGDSPKSARHLPYKSKEGGVDLPHLRNALARCNQIKSVLGTESTESMRKRACSKAQRLGNQHLKTKK